MSLAECPHTVVFLPVHLHRCHFRTSPAVWCLSAGDKCFNQLLLLPLVVVVVVVCVVIVSSVVGIVAILLLLLLLFTIISLCDECCSTEIALTLR